RSDHMHTIQTGAKVRWNPGRLRLNLLRDHHARIRVSTGIPDGRRSDHGTTIHVALRGSGPPVVLLHGYAEPGEMWAPMAIDLGRDQTVVVPDLRGMGLSAKPAGGFDKKTQAYDVAGVLDALKIDQTGLVAHDIGNMVGYAFAAQFPSRVRRFALI